MIELAKIQGFILGLYFTLFYLQQHKKTEGKQKEGTTPTIPDSITRLVVTMVTLFFIF